MHFDARAAKLLKPGEHLTIDSHPGLRLKCMGNHRNWIYRYKSPLDGRMRQIKIGVWPAMSPAAAMVEWARLRVARDAGHDLAVEKRAARAVSQGKPTDSLLHAGEYKVRQLCDDYLLEHIEQRRKRKGADEVGRMFITMLGGIADTPAADVTRTQAFELIHRFSASAPVQAGKLRAELGAAWDHALDAGRLPDSTPNWWRMILRGKIKSKGKKIQGENVGTSKRVLTPQETGALIRWLPNFTALIEDVLTVYLWVAARGSEIVLMEGREIRQEDGVWWWEQPKAKTKNARHERATDLRLPLFGRALAVVQRRRELHGDGWLFPAKLADGRVEPVQQKTIQATVYYHQPYCNTRPTLVRPRVPVTHWAPHDLRRTARTRLAALGCPAEVGETIIGHMLPGVQGIYDQHKYDAEKLEWLKRLSDHMEALASQ